MNVATNDDDAKDSLVMEWTLITPTGVSMVFNTKETEFVFKVELFGLYKVQARANDGTDWSDTQELELATIANFKLYQQSKVLLKNDDNKIYSQLISDTNQEYSYELEVVNQPDTANVIITDDSFNTDKAGIYKIRANIDIGNTSLSTPSVQYYVATPLQGIISEDLVIDPNSGPFVLTGLTQVAPDSKLTILPGGTLFGHIEPNKFDKNGLEIYGELKILGENDNLAILRNLIISFKNNNSYSNQEMVITYAYVKSSQIVYTGTSIPLKIKNSIFDSYTEYIVSKTGAV